VREGQALALLGNSGNSDAPRLRFQLVDADSPFGSEFKGRLLGGPVRVTRVVETRIGHDRLPRAQTSAGYLWPLIIRFDTEPKSTISSSWARLGGARRCQNE
jgi:hypothetical protein